LFDHEESVVKTTEIKKFEGEVTYCNRKRKHMFFYELQIHLSWEACIQDKTIKGEIKIPNLTEDEPIASTHMQVTTSSKDTTANEIKKRIESDAIPKVRTLFEQIFDDARERFKEPLV